MSFRVICGSNEKAAMLARIALKNRLYVSGWSLREVLAEIVEVKGFNSTIAIVFADGGKPVSICANKSHETMFFTRKSFRRQQHATAALKAIISISKNDIYGNGNGIAVSKLFFEKNKLPWHY